MCQASARNNWATNQRTMRVAGEMPPELEIPYWKLGNALPRMLRRICAGS